MGQNFLDVWDGNQQKIYSTFKDFIWYIAEDANTQTGVKSAEHVMRFNQETRLCVPSWMQEYNKMRIVQEKSKLESFTCWLIS